MRITRFGPGLLLLLLASACGTPDDAPPAASSPAAGAGSADASAAPAAAPPSATFACDDLARTILPVDPTRRGLEGRFGPPDSVAVRTAPNRHDATVTDSLFTVRYAGLRVEIHGAGGRDLPDHVFVEDDRFLTPGAPGIGDTAAEVEAALGEPTRRTATALVYECGEVVEEPVTFHLAEGRVVDRIEIDYYVD